MAAEDGKPAGRPVKERERKTHPYDAWMESVQVPIYRGHYVEDLRAAKLGWWEERKSMSAFLQLKGMEGVSEARIVEIPAGGSIPPLKFSLGELIYVLEGTGNTSVWNDDRTISRTFEWADRSLFHIPRHLFRQFHNASGSKPARLLFYNYLPVAMSTVPDPDYFFGNPYSPNIRTEEMEEMFGEAKPIKNDSGEDSPIQLHWEGNFFPDLDRWDRLENYYGRGAGGSAVFMRFPGDLMGAHMSVFDPRVYKKAHRHGPGRVIVIPAGEGYSLLWGPDGKKIVCPWHESTVFVPPQDWYHQHFNVGNRDARYLALGPLKQFQGKGEGKQGRAERQIEYPDEDPWIRQKFEEELAKRGNVSGMPDIAYKDRNYEWDYGDDL